MIPDRARLGLGTMQLLSQLQTLEKVSVDALVARAVAMYHQQQIQKNTEKEISHES
ncbi:hypothetical protein UFOVP371_12 [uncultured Caudovirales phage]|uniref:Uncharacterized protein n=1 Tax=uncultured Caudovirales phage TaxID=2100421 RepID=A0A6J7WWQ5_9CAUD|nr:hypothetical protein UFOVP371_12 [uncultured Caudovirales phage]